MRMPAVVLFCLGLAALPCSGAEPDEFAVISLRSLFRLAHVNVATVEGVAAHSVTITISSTRPDVSSKDIQLSLETDSTSQRLPVDPDGRVDVPFTRQLLADDAKIVTNQPKGSIKINTSIVVKTAPIPLAGHLENGRISYTALVEIASATARRVEEKVGPPAKLAAAESDASAFTMRGPSPAAIIIWTTDRAHSAHASIEQCGKTKPLRAVKPGWFYVQTHDQTFMKGARIKLSEDHDWKCLLVGMESLGISTPTTGPAEREEPTVEQN